MRLEDNPALSAATKESEVVIPVFVFDSESETSKSKLRNNFLIGALIDLDLRLKRVRSKLLITQGDPSYELTKIIGRQSSIPVFANAGYSKQSKKVETLVAKHTQLRLFSGQVSVDPYEISKKKW